MNIRKFPVLKMFLPYLAGILFSYFFISTNLNPLIFFIFCMGLLLLSLVLRFIFPWRGQLPALLSLCFAFFLLAVIQTNLCFHPRHYSDTLKMVQNSDYFTVRITENPVEKEKSYKLIVQLLSEKKNNFSLPQGGLSVEYN